MLKITHLSPKKKKKIYIYISNKLADGRPEQIIDLNKRVNSDDLIYRYRGNTADVKFDEFDNALNIINKIQNGKISLEDVKKKSREI